MQTSHAQTSNLIFPAERRHQASGFAKFLAFFSSLLNVRASVEDKIAAKYEGCAWCDSTEQQITQDVARY